MKVELDLPEHTLMILDAFAKLKNVSREYMISSMIAAGMAMAMSPHRAVLTKVAFETQDADAVRILGALDKAVGLDKPRAT